MWMFKQMISIVIVLAGGGLYAIQMIPELNTPSMLIFISVLCLIVTSVVIAVILSYSLSKKRNASPDAPKLTQLIINTSYIYVDDPIDIELPIEKENIKNYEQILIDDLDFESKDRHFEKKNLGKHCRSEVLLI